MDDTGDRREADQTCRIRHGLPQDRTGRRLWRSKKPSARKHCLAGKEEEHQSQAILSGTHSLLGVVDIE